MKKSLFSFIFILTHISLNALSQGWRIAPMVGLNVSTISFSSAYNSAFNSSTVNTSFGPAIRFQVGALMDYASSDRFSIRSGLIYTSKGSNITIRNMQSGAAIQGSIQSNYIEIPLLLNVAIGNSGYRLIGGPVLGIALNGKVALESSSYSGYSYFQGSNTNLSVGSELTDGLLPTELSASLGLVKVMQLADHPLEIGLHVQPSFSNWDPTSNRNSNYVARNLLVGLRVAYPFELRR